MSATERRAVSRRAGMSRWLRQRFGSASFAELGLPGGDLVDVGLADLAEGKTSLESLLVSLGAPRLRREGVPLRSIHEDAEDRLYDLLTEVSAGLAHARYRAYLRQLTSFADACRGVRVDRERA